MSISEAVPEQVDDIIITSLPLLFVHRHGNKLAGGVASVLCGVEHALLSGLAEITESEGKEGKRGPSTCMTNMSVCL